MGGDLVASGDELLRMASHPRTPPGARDRLRRLVAALPAGTSVPGGAVERDVLLRIYERRSRRGAGRSLPAGTLDLVDALRAEDAEEVLGFAWSDVVTGYVFTSPAREWVVGCVLAGPDVPRE